MYLKQGKKFQAQVHELIEQCNVSRDQRIASGQFWKQVWLTGRVGGESNDQAQYNKVWVHIDDIQSQLYSPVEVRAGIVYDKPQDPQTLAQAEESGSILTREFADRDIDIIFDDGLECGLVKGWGCVKLGWGHEGIDGGTVEPEMFGVLNEAIKGIDNQEAFCHTNFISRAQCWRLLEEHPERNDIYKRILAGQAKRSDDDPLQESWFHQIVIGGTQPVATAGPTNPSGGIVSVVGAPIPMVSAEVMQNLIRVDELWVVDDKRQDYTTIQVVWPDVIIEGQLQRRNLFLQGSMKGEHPFIEIVPIPMRGFFWGVSEIAQILGLQDLVNKRITDFNRIWRKQADPPMVIIGGSGINDERVNRLKKPGGWLSEENPNAKITPSPPELPQGAFDELKQIIQFFEDVSGTAPIMQGKGEPGVRAGSHARTLLRTASSRVRKKALLVERQLEDCLDKCFKVLQSKDPDIVKIEGGPEFTLAQLPQGYSVKVDSHSASPAFSEDAQELAFELHARGAIDNEDLINLTHPPHRDILLRKAKARAQAEAEFRKEHPEEADAQARGGKKR